MEKCNARYLEVNQLKLLYEDKTKDVKEMSKHLNEHLNKANELLKEARAYHLKLIESSIKLQIQIRAFTKCLLH